MELVDCLLCGHSGRKVRFRGRDALHGGPGEFTLVECTRCGFLYLSPRPDPTELQHYYPADYLPYRPALPDESSLVRRFDRLVGLHKRCGLVLRHVSTGALLDVGCGTGDFLAAMRTYPGWSVRGLEPHPIAAARARDRYRLPVDQGYLDESRYAANSFDVVTLWDVLEHVPCPRDSLTLIHRILRPGGFAIFALPNRDSFDARIFGRYWAGLDVPRHFSVFTGAQILKTLCETGFSEARITSTLGGHHVFALSVRIWLNDRSLPTWMHALLDGILGSLPMQIASVPYFATVRFLRRGPSMVVVARKPDLGAAAELADCPSSSHPILAEGPS